MSALNFLQFLGMQNSCLATSKILWLEIDQHTLIIDLLLQSAWSRGCQTKLSSDTASSAGHKCHSLPETANYSTFQDSSPPSPHLSPPLTSMPCQPYTHSLLETSLIHGVITCTQLRLTRDKCQEGGAHLVMPKAGRQHITPQWQFTPHKPPLQYFPCKPWCHSLLPHHA